MDGPPLFWVVVRGVADVDIAAARPLGSVSLVAEDDREKLGKEAVELAIRGRVATLAKGGREAAIAPKQETVGRVPAAADLTHDLVKGALSRAETVEPRLSLLPDEGFFGECVEVPPDGPDVAGHHAQIGRSVRVPQGSR